MRRNRLAEERFTAVLEDLAVVAQERLIKLALKVLTVEMQQQILVLAAVVVQTQLGQEAVTAVLVS